MKRSLRKLLILLGCLSAVNVNVAADVSKGIAAYGRLVEVAGRNIHINCLGSGRPVVVFDSGLGGFSMDWLMVQEQLMDSSTVCAYDRAGYGWSDEGPSPRITEQIVEEFHELLSQAGMEPPFVLVGQSFGGYNVQYFSKLYPRLVAGLVLVESSHPDQFERLPDIPMAAVKSRSRQRLMTMFDTSILLNYPAHQRRLVGQMLSSEKSIRTQQREFLNFTQSGAQVGQVNRQLDIPLAVITRGKRVWKDTPYGQQQEQVWMDLQKDLLQLSTDSWQVIAKDSGHSVHLQQPDLVARTIVDVLNRVCESYPNYYAEDGQNVAMCAGTQQLGCGQTQGNC